VHFLQHRLAEPAGSAQLRPTILGATYQRCDRTSHYRVPPWRRPTPRSSALRPTASIVLRYWFPAGKHSPSRSSHVGLVLSSFGMEDANERDCTANSYESIDQYFRPMASSLRLELNHSSRRGLGLDLCLMPATLRLLQVSELLLRLTFKEVSDGVTL
jgi:hypothetical protein